jgi:thiamine-monophosphate kinase
MTELELVRWIRSQPGVAGIGDDCAILPGTRAGEELILKADQFIEDIHFRRTVYSAGQAGAAALARSLSDLAASGATPRWCLLSLALPGGLDGSWTKGFFRGLLNLARAHRLKLVGGDLARAGRIYADVVVAGVAPRGKALRRRGASADDGIFVSGVLGSAAVALRRSRAWIPSPRLALGRALRNRATSCMDLSDGLSIDLHRLCLESGVSAVVDRPLPVASGATLDDALHGGEDYELLFTAASAPPSHRGLSITRIGTIVRGRAGEVTFFGHKLLPLGYDHFR